jgi:hypothetical protein
VTFNARPEVPPACPLCRRPLRAEDEAGYDAPIATWQKLDDAAKQRIESLQARLAATAHR